MALTPEDVVKKEFTKPKGFGRSGYDEIQVDDFLDEIVVELRRLNAENEDLTGKLEDCHRSKGQPGRAEADVTSPGANTPAAASPAAAVPALTPVSGGKDTDETAAVPNAEAAKAAKADLAAAQGELKTARDELTRTKAELDQAKSELTNTKQEQERAETALRDAQERLKTAQQQLDDVQRQHSDAAQAPAALAASGEQQGQPAQEGQRLQASPEAQQLVSPESAAGVIALAQRLHDEHVREGETTRDRLIGEATTQREQLISEATSQRDELVSTGQSRHDELIAAGQSRHDELVQSGQTQHDDLVRTGTEQSEQMVREAEERKNRILTELNTERDRVTTDIDKLRAFEGDYRTKLRGYIEGHLSQLDHTAVDGDSKSQG
ncbi:DivIVA domain-containing protein [Flexivirga meconopsidis]|uniref:DivIVA domain-containing protein n=1 Tax=Flexivirga meconopsidis TaxID=2977121 RepID=UPI002447BB47|nr:DivIVA domain-containing protein [Flexivirga meconopsidis]